MDIIEFNGVTKSFEKKVCILDDFNLKIARGDFAVIYGPSAVGKTTILNLVAGLDEPDSGSIRWGGAKLPPKIGFVFQNYERTLFPWLSNARNIEMPLVFNDEHMFSSTKRNELVLEMIEKLRLNIPLDNYPFQMSGGGKQKVALARALISRPDILLLDEPFNSLDINDRDYMRQEIVRIWRELNITILFVTHDLEEALIVGNKLIILGGRPVHLMSEPILLDFPYPRDISAVTSERFFESRSMVLRLFERAKKELLLGTKNEI